MDQDNANFSTCWCTGIAIIPRTIFALIKHPKKEQPVKNVILLLSPNFRHFIHRLSTFESGNPISLKAHKMNVV